MGSRLIVLWFLSMLIFSMSLLIVVEIHVVVYVCMLSGYTVCGDRCCEETNSLLCFDQFMHLDTFFLSLVELGSNVMLTLFPSQRSH